MRCRALRGFAGGVYLLFSVGKAVRPTEQLDDRSVEATARGTNHLSSRRSSLAETSHRDRRKLRTFLDSECSAGTSATNCLTGYGVFFENKDDADGDTRLFKIMNEGKADGKEHSVWEMWMELLDKGEAKEKDAIPVNVKGVQPPWLYFLGDDTRMYFQVNMSAAAGKTGSEIETGASLVESTRRGNMLVGLDGKDEKNKYIRIACYYNGLGPWFDNTQKEYVKWDKKSTALPKCGSETGDVKAPNETIDEHFEERVETSIKGEEGDGNKDGGGDTVKNSGSEDTDKQIEQLEEKGTKEEKT